jgi:hypothetical protein
VATAEAVSEPVMVFNISIEAEGPMPSDEAIEEFGEVLEHLGGKGPSVGAGGLAGGPFATFTVAMGVAEPFEQVLGQAVTTAVTLFKQAAEKVGIAYDSVARVDLMNDWYQERFIMQPGDEYVGVTEIAKLLGVSKQRVSELRTREDFPAPVAELAAGPVWSLSNLKLFIAEWPRKPGRPKGKVVARTRGSSGGGLVKPSSTSRIRASRG